MSQEEDTAYLLDNVVSPTVIPGQVLQPEPPPRRTIDVPMQNPIAHRTRSRINQPALDPLPQEPDSPPPFKDFDQPEQNSPMPSSPPPSGPSRSARVPITSIALRPADAIDGPVDFTNKIHVSIYNEMSKELPDTYNGSTETLCNFLAQVQHRANNSNWTDMVTITILGTPAINLISRHGFVMMDQVRHHETTFWARPSRDTQNLTAMYTAIYDSLEQPYLLFMTMMYTMTIVTAYATTTNSPEYVPCRSHNTNISQWLQSWAYWSINMITQRVWIHVQHTITNWHKRLPRKPPWYAKNQSRKINIRPRQRKIGLRYNHKLAIATIALIGIAAAADTTSNQQDDPMMPIALTSHQIRVRPPMTFDTDSFVIAVDNCATRSITNDLSDFVETRQKTKLSTIKGVSRLIQVLRQGTIRWNICDDKGKTHEILLPNSFYAPQAPMRLLSPQHWAQSLAVAQKTQDATCTTTAKNVQLKWDTFTKTIPLDICTNFGLLSSSPSYQKSSTFIDAHEDTPTPICLRAQVRICNDPQDNEKLANAAQTLQPTKKVTFAPEVEEHQQLKLRHAIRDLEDSPDATTIFEKDSAEPIAFNIDEPPLEPEDPELPDAQQELLRWHLQLGHLSFKKLRLMALSGCIPRRLATCRAPKCAACLYGKATKTLAHERQ